MTCAVCGHPHTTRAHVKDKSVCEKEGIVDHEYLNIIELCYSCHYDYFDRSKMGVYKSESQFFFAKLNEQNEIEIITAKYTLNVREEYIKWKNKRCKPKLWKTLFK